MVHCFYECVRTCTCTVHVRKSYNIFLEYVQKVTIFSLNTVAIYSWLELQDRKGERYRRRKGGMIMLKRVE